MELIYRHLVAILRAAVADKLITESPCRGIRPPSIEKPKVVPLPVESVLALVDVMPPRYRALVVLAAGTGLRQGEAFGVTVDRVDFLRKTLRVDQQVVMYPGVPPHLAPLKTTASYRTVPLAPVIVEALAAHLAAFPGGPEGLVFVNDKHKTISRTDFGVVWRRAVQEAALPAGSGMHDLRHFYASVLIRSGASVKVVQERLGHSSAIETLDTYSHLFADEEDRSRQAVEDVLGGNASIPASIVGG